MSLIKKGTFVKSTSRGKCKPCHSNYNTQRQKTQAIEKFPDNYIECLDCGEYIFRYRKGRSPYKKRTPVKSCKYCGSNNLEISQQTGEKNEQKENGLFN